MGKMAWAAETPEYLIYQLRSRNELKAEGLELFEELGVLAFAGTGGDFEGFGLVVGVTGAIRA